MFALLAVVGSASAAWLKPQVLLASISPAADYKNSIPLEFGNWKGFDSDQTIIVPRDVQQKLDETYDQLVSRTYVSDDGYRIMLAIAYGANQGDATEVHKPEVCYPAQGFAIAERSREWIQTEFGDIRARKLLTRLGSRVEPVTYWIVSGRKIVDGNLDKKLKQLSLSVDGLIPDGLLFRVSSIDNDSDRAYRRQVAFVRELLKELDSPLRQQLAGLPVN